MREGEQPTPLAPAAEGISIGAFVAARGPALLRLAWLLTADPETAQDLVQDALARVMPHWPRIAATGHPEPYVRKAIRSAWTDSWRRRGARPDVVRDLRVDGSAGTGGDGDAPDAGIEGAAARVDLAQALARLTPRQRAVLVLRFYEDLTEAQTAQMMGCSISTVKSQTRHALERLRVLAPELVLRTEEEMAR
jgi:RNA polymerase sigma-70 factor (sigma-E family)